MAVTLWAAEVERGLAQLAFQRDSTFLEALESCGRSALECELLHRRRFKTQAEARMAVFKYIEGWYNPHRRHSAFDLESPINHERRHQPAA